MNSSPLAHHLYTMACNNAWANHRLLAACAKLSQADFVAPRTSFFPSLKATLNHNLTVDWYYVDALERGLHGQPPNLDAGRFYEPEEPFDTCAALSSAQHAVDRRLVAVCASLTDADLSAADRRAAARRRPARNRHAAARASLPAPDPPSRTGARDACRHGRRAAAARRILLRERGASARGGTRGDRLVRSTDLAVR